MKAFTVDSVEYSVKQDFGSTGIRYRARYQDGTQALAFIAGKGHTRQQVIDAISNVNEPKDDEHLAPWEE